MKLDLPQTSDCIFELIHKSDDTKNYKKEKGNKCQKDRRPYGFDTFYPIDKLATDGFIHADGSLKVRFYVKKINYRLRLEEAEDKFKELKE